MKQRLKWRIIFTLASLVLMARAISATLPGASIYRWGQSFFYPNSYDADPVLILNNYISVEKMCSGDGYVLILARIGTDERRIFGIGNNTFGQLGREPIAAPTLTRWVEIFPDIDAPSNWSDVACGTHHAVAIDTYFRVYAWGRNLGGALVGDQSSPMFSAQPLSPGIGTEIPMKVAAGSRHTLMLSEQHNMVTWGAGSDGQLGRSDTSANPGYVELPRWLAFDDYVVDIAAAGCYNFALTMNGTLLSWGCNDYSALGRAYETTELPGKVELPNGVRPMRVFAGVADRTNDARGVGAFITDNGELYVWGATQKTETTDEPEKVDLPLDDDDIPVDFAAINSPNGPLFAVPTAAGRLITWGANYNAALGRYTSSTFSKTPEVVDVLSDKTITHAAVIVNGMLVSTPDMEAFGTTVAPSAVGTAPGGGQVGVDTSDTGETAVPVDNSANVACLKKGNFFLEDFTDAQPNQYVWGVSVGNGLVTTSYNGILATNASTTLGGDMFSMKTRQIFTYATLRVRMQTPSTASLAACFGFAASDSSTNGVRACVVSGALDGPKIFVEISNRNSPLTTAVAMTTKPDLDFHVYELNWNSTAYTLYVDGDQVYYVENTYSGASYVTISAEPYEAVSTGDNSATATTATTTDTASVSTTTATSTTENSFFNPRVRLADFAFFDWVFVMPANCHDACPGDCGTGRGRCVDGACICHAGYGGTDCTERYSRKFDAGSSLGSVGAGLLPDGFVTGELQPAREDTPAPGFAGGLAVASSFSRTALGTAGTDVSFYELELSTNAGVMESDTYYGNGQFEIEISFSAVEPGSVLRFGLRSVGRSDQEETAQMSALLPQQMEFFEIRGVDGGHSVHMIVMIENTLLYHKELPVNRSGGVKVEGAAIPKDRVYRITDGVASLRGKSTTDKHVYTIERAQTYAYFSMDNKLIGRAEMQPGVPFPALPMRMFVEVFAVDNSDNQSSVYGVFGDLSQRADVFKISFTEYGRMASQCALNCMAEKKQGWCENGYSCSCFTGYKGTGCEIDLAALENKKNNHFNLLEYKGFLIVGGIIIAGVLLITTIGMLLYKRHRDKKNRVKQMARKHKKVADKVKPPTGVVTLVFTDVQNSTVLWEQKPRTMKDSLEKHNDLARKLIAKHRGYEVRTEGDAFMIAFHNPKNALMWCLDMQKGLLHIDWLEKLLDHPDAKRERLGEGSDSDDDDRKSSKPKKGKHRRASEKAPLLWNGLRVRMGIHLGEPFLNEDPNTKRIAYYGPMVHRAAKVADAGHGGQVVMSEEVYNQLNRKKLRKKVKFKDLGLWITRGLEHKEHLYQALPRELAKRKFPPPRAKPWTREWEEEKKRKEAHGTQVPAPAATAAAAAAGPLQPPAPAPGPAPGPAPALAAVPAPAPPPVAVAVAVAPAAQGAPVARAPNPAPPMQVRQEAQRFELMWQNPAAQPAANPGASPSGSKGANPGALEMQPVADLGNAGMSPAKAARLL